MNVPVDAVFAAALPENVPKKALAIIATLAGPARSPPNMALAKLIKSVAGGEEGYQNGRFQRDPWM